ncbi:MAG: TPM domain-containing protein [Deltaproteobacteria bacterium]|nr:TPM domain-containing protein [Deltaproteobacteria bacterium]
MRQEGSARLAGLLVAILACVHGPVRAVDLPATDERCVNDHAGIVGKQDRTAIRSLCHKARKDGVEMVVVTIRSLEEHEVRSSRLDFFVDEIFDDWDIDYDAASSAIMLFVSHKDRQIRIRMGEKFNDKAWKKASQIMRHTVGPGLRRRPSRCIRKGFDRLFREVAEPYICAEKKKAKKTDPKRGRVNFE